MKFSRFKKAEQDLRNEIDLEAFIYNMRILKMIMRAVTLKRQRKAVQYFSRFVLQDDRKVKQDLVKEELTAE